MEGPVQGVRSTFFSFLAFSRQQKSLYTLMVVEAHFAAFGNVFSHLRWRKRAQLCPETYLQPGHADI